MVVGLILRGGLTQGLNPNPMGTPRSSSLKATIIPKWVTFLELDFHPTTYGPPNHRGLSGWTWYLQPIMWETRGSPLEEIGAIQLVCACSSCSPLKGGNNLWGLLILWDLLILIMPVSGIHRLRPPRKWSNIDSPWFTSVTTLESPIFVSLFSEKICQ